MALLNVDQAVVARQKIVDYLLSLTHESGRSKAVFFLAFGFTIDEWETMAAALKDHAATNPVAHTEDTPFGTRYRVEGPISTPDDRDPEIRSVWFMATDDDVPRFVTAYPLK